MSIDIGASPDAAVPDSIRLHEANLNGIKEVLPTLTRLREEQQVMTAARLPDDHSHFPGEPASVEPYYFNRHGPYSLGMWRIVAGSGDSRLEGRLLVKPRASDYTFDVKGLDGSYEPATLAQEEQLGSLLPLFKQVA